MFVVRSFYKSKQLWQAYSGIETEFPVNLTRLAVCVSIKITRTRIQLKCDWNGSSTGCEQMNQLHFFLYMCERILLISRFLFGALCFQRSMSIYKFMHIFRQRCFYILQRFPESARLFGMQ